LEKMRITVSVLYEIIAGTARIPRIDRYTSYMGMSRHRSVRWAFGIVLALLLAGWEILLPLQLLILVPLLLPGVLLVRVLELLPGLFTDRLNYLAPSNGTAASLVIAEVVVGAGLFWMAVVPLWAWRRKRTHQKGDVSPERLTKTTAVLLALLVPFIVQYALYVGDIRFLPQRQLPPPLPPLDLYWLLQFFLTATTGFVFVARVFRRPHAAAIGAAYYPLMMTALFGFGIGLAGGI
jgi:hypothetical protein